MSYFLLHLSTGSHKSSSNLYLILLLFNDTLISWSFKWHLDGHLGWMWKEVTIVFMYFMCIRVEAWGISRQMDIYVTASILIKYINIKAHRNVIDHNSSYSTVSPMAQQPLVGQDLIIIEASRSHSDTPHSVGLLWTSDQPDAQTSTRQNTTLTTDIHPCLWRDSNPRFKQESFRIPTL